MKKYIYIILSLLLVSAVYGAVTNTDVSNSISKFAGRIGIGVDVPREALDVNGSIVLGANLNETSGTVRYANDRFEGKLAAGWKVLNEENRGTNGGYLYNTTTDYYFNGTKLNATIDARNTGKASDGDYLYNDSTTMYFNGTKLNASIDARNTGKAAGGNYLYNDSDTIYYNVTYGNSQYVLKDVLGNANLSQKNITQINSIIGYYGTTCAAGEFVRDIADDGTFFCVSTGAVSVGGGWSNTTTTTETTLTVMINGTMLYVNTTTNRVGINTNTPDSKLQVNGNFSASDGVFTNNVTITNDLAVSGDIYASTDLTVTNNVTITNDLTVSGDIYASTDLTVTNNATVTNDLTVSGDIFADNMTDRYGHEIKTNTTCKIITGATATFSIC